MYPGSCWWRRWWHGVPVSAEVVSWPVGGSVGGGGGGTGCRCQRRWCRGPWVAGEPGTAAIVRMVPALLPPSTSRCDTRVVPGAADLPQLMAGRAGATGDQRPQPLPGPPLPPPPPAPVPAPHCAVTTHACIRPGTGARQLTHTCWSNVRDTCVTALWTRHTDARARVGICH